MSDFRRTYQIILPVDQPVPSIRQLIRKQLRNGARWSDLIEVKHGTQIIVFGVMNDVYNRYGRAQRLRLRRLMLTERDFINAIADGSLDGPQEHNGAHFAPLCISRSAFGGMKPRNITNIRDADIWLSEHMQSRVIGLPVLGGAAAGPMDSDDFGKPVHWHDCSCLCQGRRPLVRSAHMQ